MNELAVKVLAIVILLGAVFGAGAYLNGNRWEKKLTVLQSEYDTFRGGVAALG